MPIVTALTVHKLQFAYYLTYSLHKCSQKSLTIILSQHVAIVRAHLVFIQQNLKFLLMPSFYSIQITCGLENTCVMTKVNAIQILPVI